MAASHVSQRVALEEIRRLLFVRLRSLGDTVLMTPLPTVAGRLRNCQVAVLVEEPFGQVLEGHPDVSRLISISSGGVGFLNRLKALLAIRSFDPDLTIDLHGGSTSALFTLFSGSRWRVGYRVSRFSWAYNTRIPDSRQIWGRDRLHTVEHQLSPLRFLGFPVDPIPPLWVGISKRAQQHAMIRLRQQGCREGFVLIHPAAAFDTKQWDPLKFADLARRLSRDGKTVVITAGPGESALLDIIRSQAPPEVVFWPPAPLKEFMALVASCGLYIGNDTGPTHVAAALGKPVVVVFGSSHADSWRPWNVAHRVLQADLPCIPCPGYVCLQYDEPLCIRSIEVADVYEAAQSLL